MSRSKCKSEASCVKSVKKEPKNLPRDKVLFVDVYTLP